MSRLSFSLAIILMTVMAGCVGSDQSVQQAPFRPDEPLWGSGQGADDQQPPAASTGAVSAQGIAAVVVDTDVQRDRIVVTLDAGSAEGVASGMKGVLANGRRFSVVSVDTHSCRAVIAGLNVRVASGTGATIYTGSL